MRYIHIYIYIYIAKDLLSARSRSPKMPFCFSSVPLGPETKEI